jgi:hypothetical protein
MNPVSHSLPDSETDSPCPEGQEEGLERVAVSRSSVGGILFCAALAASCAERMGARATSGMMDEIRRQKELGPSEQISTVAAGRAVGGALDELGEPERREQIQSLAAVVAAAAADAAVRDFARRMVVELGPDGEGPLAASISGTGERISAAVIGGARAELAGVFPDCQGPDTLDCIEKRLERMTRSAGAGFATGVRDAIGWPLLILVGLLGLVIGALGHWVWSIRPQQRALRTT